MEANAAAVLDLFETKMQIEVPLFQRQYVWDRERHWDPRATAFSERVSASAKVAGIN